MLVVGAGGHALEILDVLNETPGLQQLFFFDDVNPDKKVLKAFSVLKSLDEVYLALSGEFEFVLAVGEPVARKKLYDRFILAGGRLVAIRSSASFVSPYSTSAHVDVMKNCFVGPDTCIGTGTLINTGAQLHHQVCVGRFVEVSPRAVLLGNVSVGSYSRIGANVTVLPNIKIGKNATIAAGSVVRENIPDNCMAAGVPSVVKKDLPPLPYPE